ncbi:hypothetical protein R1flu_000801 [Riccia fluitans]|uniref:SHSP domain-containing protein n=1 Tax=Riccia fluitans TaxID=41844 RepID=A0ABD1Y1U7_9MARC
MDIFFGQDPLAGAVIFSTPDEFEKSVNPRTRNYARDAKAMGNTAVDVKELPESYVFIADMPGLKSEDIKVQVENDNVLTIGSEESEKGRKPPIRRSTYKWSGLLESSYENSLSRAMQT